MNYVANVLRGFTKPPNTSIVSKVIGFWALFWLILAGLRIVQLSSLGSAAAPIAAGTTIMLTLTLIAGLLRIDGGSLHEIGLSLKVRKSLGQFVLGVGLGVAVVAGMFLLLLLLTPLEINASTNRNILAVLGASFVVLFVLALMEELAFRSYSLFRLRQVWGTRSAIYITSIAFAFYHGFAFGNLLGPGVWGLF